MSVRSAECLLPIVAQHFNIRSVADFGCGRGGWLAAWKGLGVETVQGFDGDYLRYQTLLIEDSEMQFGDLCQPVALGRQFDLVQSLEVAEHLPKSAAKTFIETLTRHGDLVLFSAATPGQGGMSHINEQPFSYWRKHFDSVGFVPLDCVRPTIQARHHIEIWYRYNTLIYVEKERLATLAPEVRAMAIKANQAIPDFSSRLYRTRKLLIRPLPVFVVNWLSSLKAKCHMKLPR